ncbi:RNA polymerase sigma factor [Thermoflexibacter ruber]|uniref:RNA polymerase sigma-70 factor, ECF subfamily n=1 Tax=Thermoflexibacter ruber TaxID=1003 RepID=A0A1I2HCA1_9BACT|nr:RNA polymerase sigma factor [Thermoflexibacter ruber]SFF27804.1 RNA polymerase sigma-70 factor, ECF subfamily [Thermoflexibacter ruber]
MQQINHDSEERKLVSACIRNDAKAQRILYEHYYKKMYVVALRYSKTTFEAEDILQEAFIKIFQNIQNFNFDSSLDYWIKRIVVNTALKQNRKILEKMHMEDVAEIHDEPVADTVFATHNFQELLKMIQKLSTGYQVIFNLYAIEGYKHSEIAEMLGISEGTSKSQYARAKAQIQKMLEKEEEKIRINQTA